MKKACRVFEDVDVGVVTQVVHEWCQRVRANVVVGVDECDVCAFGFVDACIAGVTESAVLLVDDPNALVFRGPFVANLGTMVR